MISRSSGSRNTLVSLVPEGRNSTASTLAHNPVVTFLYYEGLNEMDFAILELFLAAVVGFRFYEATPQLFGASRRFVGIADTTHDSVVG